MRQYDRVLALGAHTDDIELGCGATLSLLKRQGAEVRVVAFSRAEASLPEGLAADTLEVEFRKAMGVIGIGDDAITVGNVPVRHFPAHRQDILEELVAVNRAYQPDLVLTMNSNDTHQDHEVMHQETIRGFRGRTVLGYEAPWNQRVSVRNLYVEVAEEDVEAKIAMLACYESQAALNRSYVSPEYLRGAASFYGVAGKMKYAETFEVLNMSWRLA